MKIAILSDIHGNMIALNAVMDDIAKNGCEKTFFLGDYALAGPEPSPTVDYCMHLTSYENIEMIQGNTDKMIVDFNEETKKIYPYDFELIITYKLLGKSIDVSYEIINDSKETMYFSIGSHEGYNCMSGLKNYVIEFETEERAVPYSDLDCSFNFSDGAKGNKGRLRAPPVQILLL